jgi:simple sugar transport system substrate-binding protein
VCLVGVVSLASAGCEKKKEGLVVGFAQVGAESNWRTANSQSMKDEAAKRGIELKFVDAQQKQENQIAALRSFINQKVDLIILAPVVTTGWDPVLKDVQAAGIPIIIEDRTVDSDPSLYATFIGSDFVAEGKRAGDWLAKRTNGKCVIAELMGTPGSAAAEDRKKGFRDAIKDKPDMKILMSQTGEFTRAKGKEVMEAFLKSPDAANITALFAHNDDMALGAIQAITEAGKKPGKDIIIVSCDGEKDAFKAISDGQLNCTVECNPLLGPTVFDAVAKLTAKQPVDKRIVSPEGVYDDTTPDLLSHGF